MASTLRYLLYDYWDEVADQRMLHLPLMSGGPIPILLIVTVYVVLVTWIGPWLMRDRPPFSLRPLIIAYNLANILISFVCFLNTLVLLDYGRLLFYYRRDPPTNRSRWALYFCHFMWFYLLTKLFDLVETIFFVMRKKRSQISLLHLYHHAVVPLIVWVAIKIAPTSGAGGIFPLLNSAVHTIMYTYYLLSSLGPQYRRHLRWKRWITLLQLAQFVLYMANGWTFMYLDGGEFPKFYHFFAHIQSPLFFVLFYRFYSAAYHKGHKQP